MELLETATPGEKPFQIITDGVPGFLSITDTMISDLIFDPVMASKVLLGMELDIFQRVGLKLSWWSPHMIDSSGYGTGKSRRSWIWAQLRCLLIPGQWVGAYYPTMEQMKQVFWPYYSECSSKIFKAHLGRCGEDGEKDGKAKSRGSSAYVAFFRNGSKVICPAGGFVSDAENQGSLSFNDVLVDEYTRADEMGDGIDKQIIGRARRPTFNKEHPVWANHILFVAPAKTVGHPSYARVKEFDREVKNGNPRFTHFTSCYKNYSTNVLARSGKLYSEYRENEKIALRRKTMSRGDALGDIFGIWAVNTEGWYAEDVMLMTLAIGRRRNLHPSVSRADCERRGLRNAVYVLGIDPAPAGNPDSDDGAFSILRGIPMLPDWSDNPADWITDYVYLRAMRKPDPVLWAGFVHGLHRRFGLSLIHSDWGGGGQFLETELAKFRARVIDVESEVMAVESRVTPIITPENMRVADGDRILHFNLRRDTGIKELYGSLADDGVLVTRCHGEMRVPLAANQIGLPKPYSEWTKEELMGLTEEARFSIRNLSGIKGSATGGGGKFPSALEQFVSIETEKNEDGTPKITTHGGRKFVSSGRKDFQSSMMMGWMGFLILLRSGAGMAPRAPEDEAGSFTFR